MGQSPTHVVADAITVMVNATDCKPVEAARQIRDHAVDLDVPLAAVAAMVVTVADIAPECTAPVPDLADLVDVAAVVVQTPQKTGAGRSLALDAAHDRRWASRAKGHPRWFARAFVIVMRANSCQGVTAANIIRDRAARDGLTMAAVAKAIVERDAGE